MQNYEELEKAKIKNNNNKIHDEGTHHGNGMQSKKELELKMRKTRGKVKKNHDKSTSKKMKKEDSKGECTVISYEK